MKFSSTDIISQFPIAAADMPKIATSTNAPTFDSLTKFQQAINLQAIAIPSPHGDTNLGLLHLVIPEKDYITKSSTQQPYPVQNNPGMTPAKPTTTTVTEDKSTDPPTLTTTTITKAKPTTADLAEALRIYELQVQNYNLTTNATTQLKNLIINAVPETYIDTLKDPITMFSSVSPLDLLTHLWEEYGTITSDDLSDNYNKMTAPWHPPTPIENLFGQLKKGQEFAAKGGETFDEPQLMRLALTNILATGLFNDAGKTWSTEKAKNATFAEFKKWWTNQVKYLADHPTQAGLTTTTAGLANAVHSNNPNNMQAQMNQAIESYFAAYEEHIQEPPVETNNRANAIMTSNDEIKALLLNLQNNSHTKSTTHKENNKDKTKHPAQGLDDNGQPITYCWTHGITHNLQHTSKTCKRTADNHKSEATLNNKMGGNTSKCAPRKSNSNNNA